MPDTQQNRLSECDLIMKGGVTSGIVYPPAVLRLAKRYRFRSIGGTSAGAIAAAVTAAAEYGRERGGFEKLHTLSQTIGRGTFLLDLFQPTRETRPLLDSAYSLAAYAKGWGRPEMRGRRVRALWRMARVLREILRRNDPNAVEDGENAGLMYGLAVALALAALATFVFALSGGSPSWWSALLLLGVLGVALGGFGFAIGGVVGAVVRLVRTMVQRVPANFFGICTGRREDPVAPGPAALTDWLSESIDELAGLPRGVKPLTFGELAAKGIDLRMVTSNLSQHQPYALPFGDAPLAFRGDEFRRLFPEYVVAHLVAKSPWRAGLTLPSGFHFFPDANDLPVIVMTRLSLSFPVLLSAVPLYTISEAARQRIASGGSAALAERDLQRNLFSDGGIASNFPIHFFDNWLPRRPTFGISLTSLPAAAVTENKAGAARVSTEFLSAAGPQRTAETLDGDIPDQIVHIPRADEELPPAWVPISSWAEFIGGIWSTAQNYRDNMQSMLPSYRERIVRICLRDDEGGLNLAMPSTTIAAVMRKGDEAGEKILRHFDFEHHQWVRFQVLMAQLEGRLASMESVLREKACDCESLFSRQYESQRETDRRKRFPYPRDPAWCADALRRVTAMREIVARWGETPFFGEVSPQPKPVLRVTSEL